MSQNKFYTLLNSAYDEIFNLKTPTKEFFDCYLTPQTHVIDVGSAVGELSCYFAKRTQKVDGIEVNKALIDEAQLRAKRRGVQVQFHNDSMLNLKEYCSSNSTELICCIGNTLPHLHHDDEIISFLSSCKLALTGGSPLILQIVNYDKVLENGVKELPNIETKNYSFRRTYSKVRSDGLIDFSMVLKTHESGKKSKATIQLNPITKNKLDFYLKTAGFKGINYYGTYARDNWTPESDALIVEAM